MRSVIAGSFQFLTDILPWAPHRSTYPQPIFGPRLSGLEVSESTLDNRAIDPGKVLLRKIRVGIASVAGMRLPLIGIALIYLTLPNLPLLLSASWLGVWPHGYVNLEFLLIGALGFFLPRSAIFALLCVELIADYIYVVCYAYQFSLENLFSSLRQSLQSCKARSPGSP